MSPTERPPLGETARTAVVVVECQEGVLGASSILPALAGPAEVLVGPLGSLLQGARAVGVTVVHATYAGPLGGSALGTAPLWKALAPATDVWTDAHGGTQVLSPLLGEGDLVLPRHHGLNPAKGTELLPVLRGRGVDTIVLTGVSVNLALPLVAGEATEEGFHVVVPRDAVAGTPVEYAQQALKHTLGMLATLTTVKDLTEHWQGPGH
jgi:nicotinamidase-related amidase